MATVKISELESATSVTSSDVLPIVQNGQTKKVTSEVLSGYIIETGYENEVYWTKYDNGKLVQSFNQYITCNETRSSGGLSYYSGSATVNLPIAFKDTNYRCSSNINLANMNYFANSYVAINSESTVNVSLATTENNATRIVNVILIGEWK